MSILKSLAIASALILGVSTFANAATRHHHQRAHQVRVQPYTSYGMYGASGSYGAYDGSTSAGENFQDHFKNF